MYNHPAFINNAAQVLVNSAETRVDIVNLHPGVTYTFTVVAFNDIGDSVPSEGETATTLEEGSSLFHVLVSTVIYDVY